MVSDFLVQHPSGPFFSLPESEFKKAVHKYPQVCCLGICVYQEIFVFTHLLQLKHSNGLTYTERSATASINVGQEGYFDNATVLKQFERLFQLLEFKQEFENHAIECVVDNARRLNINVEIKK